MNCRKARKWLLLHDAGELSPDRETRLHRHLVRCAACRDFAASMQELRREVRAKIEVPPTPPPSVEAILSAAGDPEVPLESCAHAEAPRPAWGWAVAAALGLVVGLVAWWLVNQAQHAGDRLAGTDLAETEILQVMRELDEIAFAVDQGLTRAAGGVEEVWESWKELELDELGREGAVGS